MLGNGDLAKGAAGQIVTGTIQENLFILGLSFSWEDYLTYAAAEEKIFVFDPTACTCAQLIFNPLVFSANAGPITIDVYTEVSYDSVERIRGMDICITTTARTDSDALALLEAFGMPFRKVAV